MDKDKLHYFREQLIEEKKKLMKLLNNMNDMEEYGSMNIYYSDISGYDNHPADIGTEVFMMEQDNGFKNKLKDTLHEIEDSLLDIDNGSYGVCQICNNNIDNERLDLIPHLKSCIQCSNKIFPSRDTLMNNKGILSIKEDGTSFSDTTEDMVEFDREDAYQKVASFNIVPGDPSFSTGDNLNVMDEQDGDSGDGVEMVENISQEYYDETLK